MAHGGQADIRTEDIRLREARRSDLLLASAAATATIALLFELSPFACLAIAVLAAGTWSWWLERHPDPDAGCGRSKVVGGLHRIQHREVGPTFYWLPKSFRALPDDTGEPRGVPSHLEGRIRRVDTAVR